MWRRTSFSSGLISRKLCIFLFMFSTGFTSLSALLIFPLSITFLIFVRGFHSILSNIDEVLLINPSANVFVFGDFVHHKDWLTYSGGTDRYGEHCYNFSISNDLTQMVNFSTRIRLILTVLLFWIYFFLVTLVFVRQWLSPHLEILIMLLSQFPYTSHYIHNRMPRFIELLKTILLLVGTVFVIIWEMFHVRISLDSQKSLFFVCTKRTNLLNLK